MVPRTAHNFSITTRSPRSGGDGPGGYRLPTSGPGFSPLRRGWSEGDSAGAHEGDVLPAQAGMVRWTPTLQASLSRSPRSGGDGPSWAEAQGTTRMVLPAQAGMVPRRDLCRQGRWCSPRSGGDGPGSDLSNDPDGEFSPLRRGWSPGVRGSVPEGQVLPAQAGMVPEEMDAYMQTVSSPRSGGDGPCCPPALNLLRLFSPLRRGWSRSIPG